MQQGLITNTKVWNKTLRFKERFPLGETWCQNSN